MKILLTISIAALSACTAQKLYTTNGTIQITKGKATFTPTGEKKPIKDTTLYNVILISKHK
jgi:hypothetical protein